MMHRHVMLRFRPIAPKPPSAAGEQQQQQLVKVIGSGTRRKRKYVRVCATRQNKEKKKITSLDDQIGELLNETPQQKKKKKKKKGEDIHEVLQLIRSENTDKKETDLPRSVVTKTRITVECIFTDLGSGCLGVSSSSLSDDREKIDNLSKDTCPGFISDGSYKVLWVNEAFRKMVTHESNSSTTIMNTSTMVWLEVKEGLEMPRNIIRGEFSCRVKMQFMKNEGYNWNNNKVLACDVWPMDFGGFAWKLDLHTALGLGI